MLYESIKKLVQYGINTGLTPESERIYTTNLLLDLFKENNYEDTDCDLDNIGLEDVLADHLNEAVARGFIEDSIGFRDLFDPEPRSYSCFYLCHGRSKRKNSMEISGSKLHQKYNSHY